MSTQRHRVTTPMALGIIGFTLCTTLALLVIFLPVTNGSMTAQPAAASPTSAPPVRQAPTQGVPRVHQRASAFVRSFSFDITKRRFDMDYTINNAPTGYSHVMLFMQDDSGGYSYWLTVGIARGATYRGTVHESYNPDFCRKAVLVLANDTGWHNIQQTAGASPARHVFKWSDFQNGSTLLPMSGYPTSLPH